MHFPLGLKLSILTGVLLVVGTATVSLILLERTTEAIEAETVKRGRFMTMNLARNDDLVIQQLLESVAQEPGVLSARLVGKGGELLASSKPGEIGKYDRLTDKDDREFAFARDGASLTLASRMKFRAPRQENGEVDLGEAQVVLDVDGIIGPVVQTARRDVLFSTLGLLATSLLIVIWMSELITRPLRRLRVAVQALGAGDTQARVPVTTRDEVADLSRAFNEMSKNLHEKKRVETAFRRYVSDHVLREVLESPESVQLQGERRNVSVLFIDIRGFSRLAKSVDPEVLVSFLNEAFALITNRLLDHGATVDKYVGDAILAYFGAPIVTPDHPQRAIASAIAIQRSVRERNLKREVSGDGIAKLEVGIGIQTGEVVVGNIGSDLKMDYTAIGDPVNVASRLQNLARPGEIIVTDQVADAVGDRVEFEALGLVELDGRPDAVRVFRVKY
jgi:adenylate cyclase